jgi:hypothetical protein
MTNAAPIEKINRKHKTTRPSALETISTLNGSFHARLDQGKYGRDANTPGASLKPLDVLAAREHHRSLLSQSS